LDKWVTLETMGPTWKKGAHLKNWFKPREMEHSFGKECATLGKKGAHLRKRVTLGNMGSTWKYG